MTRAFGLILYPALLWSLALLLVSLSVLFRPHDEVSAAVLLFMAHVATGAGSCLLGFNIGNAT